MNEPNLLAVLPVRNTVFFPFTLAPLAVGRPLSVAAAEAGLAREDKLLAIFTQKDMNVEEPGPDDLVQYGTKAVIKRMARSDDGLPPKVCRSFGGHRRSCGRRRVLVDKG